MAASGAFPPRGAETRLLQEALTCPARIAPLTQGTLCFTLRKTGGPIPRVPSPQLKAREPQQRQPLAIAMMLLGGKRARHRADIAQMIRARPTGCWEMC